MIFFLLLLPSCHGSLKLQKKYIYFAQGGVPPWVCNYVHTCNDRTKETNVGAEPVGPDPLFVQPYRSRAMLSSASSPFSVVGLRTSVLNSPHCCGLPYRGVRTPLSSCVEPGVGLPTSLWVALPWCSPLIVVWCRTSASSVIIVVRFELPRWATHVVVEWPAAVFLPPSSSCGVGPQRWAARVVVGCPTVVFVPPSLSWGWQRAGVGCISDGREQGRTNAGHDESRGPGS